MFPIASNSEVGAGPAPGLVSSLADIILLEVFVLKMRYFRYSLDSGIRLLFNRIGPGIILQEKCWWWCLGGVV